MRTRKYKTLMGLLRATGTKQFTMSDFLSGCIYDFNRNTHCRFEMSDEALRTLSDGFCEALGCQKRKYDVVFYNMKFHRILDFGILSRLWVQMRGKDLSFTYCCGQDGNTEYPLVKRILYLGH